MHLAADVYMDFQCKKNKIAALISPNELEWYFAPSPGGNFMDMSGAPQGFSPSDMMGKLKRWE